MINPMVKCMIDPLVDTTVTQIAKFTSEKHTSRNRWKETDGCFVVHTYPTCCRKSHRLIADFDATYMGWLRE